jgi:tol-pal system protein YbgF
MTRLRLSARRAFLLPAALLAATLFMPAAAPAQDRGFLDNLFNRDREQPPPPPARQAAPEVAQAGGGDDPSVRIDRIENALRQLTGSIEQLQHQNQMLQMQLKRMQDDTEYRFQQMGGRGGAAPMHAPGNAPMPSGPTGQRSDAFNPAQNPSAPGAPRALGNPQTIAAPEPPGQTVMTDQPVGAPGGREAGAPLDLSTLAGNAPPEPPPVPPATVANAAPGPQGAPQSAPMAPPIAAPPMTQPQAGQLPPPPPRNPNGTGVQLATLPPSASPKDEYELAYGYVLHKDYGLAEQALRDFIRKYPSEKLLPDAQYWLGESQFQQQRYRDAAETFLAVSTKYARSGKAPEALLRLGQSLAALNQKEAACATLAEVGRKYPHAGASVKRGVAAEQKRTHC